MDLILQQKISAGILLNKCLIQLITRDHYDQVSFGEQFLEQEILTIENIKYLFKIENTFLCLCMISPLSTNTLEETHLRAIKVILNKTILPNFFEGLNLNKSLNFTFQVRSCVKGEYFSLENLACLPCEKNFFSLQDDYIEPSSCKSCVQEKFYCYGGFQLAPKPGYWRSDYKSTNFIKCLNSKGPLIKIDF
jgi:hypothetical protein